MQRELRVVGKYEKLMPRFIKDLASVVGDPEHFGLSDLFKVLEKGYFIRFGFRERIIEADELGRHTEGFFPQDEKTPPYVFPKDLVDEMRRWKEIDIFSGNSYRFLYHGERSAPREKRVTIVRFSGLSEAEMFYLARNVADK